MSLGTTLFIRSIQSIEKFDIQYGAVRIFLSVKFYLTDINITCELIIWHVHQSYLIQFDRKNKDSLILAIKM